ncbi:Hypothetical predicted protein [Marmota monax]|uniref:Uncharacterized protein n=1 Tax=Marmota monax TaxID=9995 RepID=A0A5E4BMY0_MARMO|nr:hypothetical protein GHT09_019786 [Marmota monax]VTJ70410.1 Hypothetical predicted protein [Marmota monax]
MLPSLTAGAERQGCPCSLLSHSLQGLRIATLLCLKRHLSSGRSPTTEDPHRCLSPHQLLGITAKAGVPCLKTSTAGVGAPPTLSQSLTTASFPSPPIPAADSFPPQTSFDLTLPGSVVFSGCRVTPEFTEFTFVPVLEGKALIWLSSPFPPSLLPLRLSLPN